MPRPTPKSLTLDLLSTLRGGQMPVSALVAAARLFRIDENRMRVAIARLLAAGQIERDERGRYRLGARADAIDRRVRAWGSLEERTQRWDGGWVAAAAGASKGPARRALARALNLLGFRLFEAGLALRPDNLRGGAAGVREELVALGAPADTFLCRLAELDAEREARARRLWDAAALARGYERSLREITSSEASLAGLPERDAMTESFLLGGRVIRELVLDPLLPDELAPSAPRRALVQAMRRYDRAGRRAWAAFMARHGAPHADAPRHGRAAASAELH
jgi:phenylacetic acid degradation operon negative regulatory protein